MSSCHSPLLPQCVLLPQVTLADLHEVAAARLAGWSAWVDSRNTLDEEDGSASEVATPLVCP